MMLVYKIQTEAGDGDDIESDLCMRLTRVPSTMHL